ncbi:hypothetical protein DFH06DRAFT_1263166 [Mycena polygramma]|nr:hypothetical protein DFH06DRAFT_1263166 [Mycena polygramma]
MEPGHCGVAVEPRLLSPPFVLLSCLLPFLVNGLGYVCFSRFHMLYRSTGRDSNTILNSGWFRLISPPNEMQQTGLGLHTRRVLPASPFDDESRHRLPPLPFSSTR